MARQAFLNWKSQFEGLGQVGIFDYNPNPEYLTEENGGQVGINTIEMMLGPTKARWAQRIFGDEE